MKTTSINLSYILLMSCFLFGFVVLAQNKDDGKSTESSIGLTADDTNLTWHPAPDFLPGCTFTILHGDMGEPNMDLFFKIPANTVVAKHWHHTQERMLLVTGELEVTYEGETPQTLKAGSYAYGPAKKPHKAKCLDSGPCLLFIALVEPFDAFPIIAKN
ncbi:cupin domain-containing protein [Flavobacteriaceae bacterium LMO-SS05]|jgi:quercetin dioxygenase-like cupin family protein